MRVAVTPRPWPILARSNRPAKKARGPRDGALPAGRTSASMQRQHAAFTTQTVILPKNEAYGGG